MTRAVVDTNVLVSGFVRSNPQAAPSRVLDAWRLRLFALVTSDHILAELEATFAQPYFRSRLNPQQVSDILDLVHSRAIIVPITVSVHGVATHPEDDMILATAVSAKADYLITGDAQLLKVDS